jgi:hypothetical protein
LVDLAGDVALEAADGFASGFVFGDAAGEVRLRLDALTGETVGGWAAEHGVVAVTVVVV